MLGLRKKSFRLLLQVLIVTTVTSVIAPLAKADLWQTASTLRKGRVSLAGLGQLIFDPNETMIFGQVGYGLAPGFQIEGRVGIGSLDSYVGGFIKYLLHGSRTTRISFWGGMHNQTMTGLDAALLLSHSFRRFQLYYAPKLIMFLEKNANDETITPLSLVGGVNVPFRRRMSFYGEFHLDVSDSYNALSAGVKYIF